MKRSGSGRKSRVNGVTTGESTPRMRRRYPHPRKCYASMPLSLEWAHPWGVATAARLDIADIHIAILDPAGPPIGVDAGVFQDQRPCMRGGRRAMYLHSSCFKVVWW